MNKIGIGIFIMAALACGTDAVDAVAQSGGTYEYTCPESGYLLTDIDQRSWGEIMIYLSFPDPWNAVDGRIVDQRFPSNLSVDGKVLTGCVVDRPVTIEVRR